MKNSSYIQFVKSVFPVYAWIPIVLVLTMNFVTYMATRLITNHMVHYDIGIFLDDMLPFVPFFISVYLLAFVQWIVGYVIISREDEKYCYKILSGEFLAKAMCMLFFFIMPTAIVRPEITGDGIWETLTKFIYDIDAPNNLFPSIHCLESYVCFRGALPLKKVPTWYKWLMGIFSVLVFASTVLLKQHFVLDIVGAIIVVEIGMYLSERLKAGRVFEAINKKVFRIGNIVNE